MLVLGDHIANAQRIVDGDTAADHGQHLFKNATVGLIQAVENHAGHAAPAIGKLPGLTAALGELRVDLVLILRGPRDEDFVGGIYGDRRAGVGVNLGDELVVLVYVHEGRFIVSMYVVGKPSAHLVAVVRVGAHFQNFKVLQIGDREVQAPELIEALGQRGGTSVVHPAHVAVGHAVCALTGGDFTEHVLVIVAADAHDGLVVHDEAADFRAAKARPYVTPGHIFRRDGFAVGIVRGVSERTGGIFGKEVPIVFLKLLHDIVSVPLGVSRELSAGFAKFHVHVQEVQARKYAAL